MAYVFKIRPAILRGFLVKVNNMDRFLIADNPMREGGTEAIIHLLEPRAIIVVDEGHKRTKWPHNHYSYTNSDKQIEQYTLSLYHCFLSTFDGEEQNVITSKLFRDAWHWYMAYMTWEDQQPHYEDEE